MAKLHTLLKKQNKTVTCAESCTGGLIAKMITDPAGSSAVFRGSFVTYCDQMKRDLLGVEEETLREHTAVSAQTACEMAVGALRRTGADLALSATGIAGPSSDEKGTPVGTVYLGVAMNTPTGILCTAKECRFAGTRSMVRLSAARGAILLGTQALEQGEDFFA